MNIPRLFASLPNQLCSAIIGIELVCRRTANSLNNERRRNDKLDKKSVPKYVRITMHQTMKWLVMNQCLRIKNETMSTVYIYIILNFKISLAKIGENDKER